MTHTSTEQPDALRVAAWLITAPQSTTIGDMLIAGRELRRLHARVQELEASQAQRVPLSDEQIAGFDRYVAGTVNGRFARAKALVRMVEAKHNITQEKQG